MNDTFSLSLQSGGLASYIILAIISIGISWWSYSKVTPQVSSFLRYLLFSLRALGIFIASLLLLEPLLTTFSEKRLGDKLAVVVDVSSSMNFTENGVGGSTSESRYQIASSLLSNHDFKGIPIRLYGFSDTLMELKELPVTRLVAGKATDLAKAMTSLAAASDPPGALLVVTDGAWNVGLNPLTAASTMDLPIYSLVVGSGISYQDVYVSRVDYPPVGYINTEFTIDVEIGANGYSGQSSQVEIRQGNNLLASQRVTLPPDGAFTTASFKLALPEPGVKNLQAMTAAVEGEATTQNNVRNFQLKLLKDKIALLLMSSSLNWEFAFLRRALEADQHFSIAAAVAQSNGRFLANDLPANPETWQKKDLIIAIDVDPRSLGSQLGNLQAAVESGCGFMFLAGFSSRVSTLQGWGKLLPIKPGVRTAVIEGEFLPLPGKQPGLHAVLSIEGMNWEQLPPLKAAIAAIIPDPEAVMLLEAIAPNGEHLPIVIGGHYNHGKTAAITGFPWWPRYFRLSADPGEIERAQQFWSNMVRWLIVREDLDRFKVIPDKAVYKLGEPSGLSATLFDDSYNLISGARIDVIVFDSAGVQRNLQLSETKPGQYAGDFGSPAASRYSFKAYALVDGDTVGTSNGNFIVEAFGLEMENPSANYSIMEQIAAITGGKSYRDDDFSKFSSELKLRTRQAEFVKEYRFTGNVVVLALVILLFVGEWGIRKFNQLP